MVLSQDIICSISVEGNKRAYADGLGVFPNVASYILAPDVPRSCLSTDGVLVTYHGSSLLPVPPRMYPKVLAKRWRTHL